jgi:pimeloyl-ACP methyl ester carboxylesterase
MLCVHGFTDTWRTWELVLHELQERHDVLAPTLPGHAGGPPLGEEIGQAMMLDALERAMDDAGFDSAHLVGNSLGGFLALALAARGRAKSVLALAPAGGWPRRDRPPGDPAGSGDDYERELERFFMVLYDQLQFAAPHAQEIVSTPEGRRRATQFITTNYEHIPAELLAHQIVGAARCEVPRLLTAITDGFELDAERIACPVRVVWGTEDRVLRWPSMAERFREVWLADAEWIELEGIGHCPQLDVPAQTASLIVEFAAA